MPANGIVVGPVEVAGVTVLAEYAPAKRWNGWLCPPLHARAAVTVLNGLDRLQRGTLAGTFRPDDTLLVVDLDYLAAGDPIDECTEAYLPDDDGLYRLGACAWTWAGTELRTIPSPCRI